MSEGEKNYFLRIHKGNFKGLPGRKGPAARKNYFPPGSLGHDFKLPIQNSKKSKYRAHPKTRFILKSIRISDYFS
jgi:hypothetical protein